MGQINQFEKALKLANKTSCCYFVGRQNNVEKKYAREKKSG